MQVFCSDHWSEWQAFLQHPIVVTADVVAWCWPADRESGESGEPEVAGGFLSPLLGVMAAVIFWDWIIHVATTRLLSPPRNVAPGLHVSLMLSPLRPFHNSAGTGEAAMCRCSRSLTPGKRQRRCAEGGADAVEVKDGETAWGKSLKVRERLQFTASIWLFHHLVPIGSKARPIWMCHWQKLSVVPPMPRQVHQ